MPLFFFLDRRFNQADRVSVAVYDENVDSPSRLNPNKVLQREKEVARDQADEQAYRRQNYEMFKKNLQKAFEEYDVNNDRMLSREEFRKFIESQAKKTG